MRDEHDLPSTLQAKFLHERESTIRRKCLHDIGLLFESEASV